MSNNPVPGLGAGFEELIRLLGKYLLIVVGVLGIIAVIFTRTPIETNWILITGFTAIGVLLALILDELRKQSKR